MLSQNISNHTTLLAVVNAKENLHNLAKSNNIMENVKLTTVDSPISYDDFFAQTLLQNKPCLLKSWATKSWRSVHEWTIKSNLKPDVPNFQVLQKNFGKTLVPVADCRKRNYNAQEKKEWQFTEYIEYWKKYIDSDYASSERCLYLKDWHFVRIFADYDAYTTPVYFTSDWLNEIWDKQLKPACDDFRFVYMGPKGSWTPFHADVYRSFSWSANICGKKKWYFYPPGYEDALRDKNNHLPYDIESLFTEEGDDQPLEVIQEPGEIIFVPSGWHHQVHNLEDTISVNHNWINSCNIRNCWIFLKNELVDVEKEIADCRIMMTQQEWTDHCQLILKVNSGMNYEDFFDFLSSIALERIRSIGEQPLPTIKPDLTFILNKTCTLFDTLISALTNSKSLYKYNYVIIDLSSMLPVLIDLTKIYQHLYNNNVCKYDMILDITYKIILCLQRCSHNI